MAGQVLMLCRIATGRHYRSRSDPRARCALGCYIKLSRFLESPYERRYFSSSREEEVTSMRGLRFRMITPTLAIRDQDGLKIPVTVPKGSGIEVVDGPLDGDRLLDVLWEGQAVMMFTTDIRERGEQIDGIGH